MTGQTLAHYEILEELGHGGMGVVYKARDTHLDRFVAIKVLPAEAVANPERKRRFVQEAKSASALNHPNIVTIFDISSDNGTDFIAMEYVAGKPLDELILRRGMPLVELLKISVQVTDALTAAHAAGIVHRDLKPANIMVGDDGRVRVLDFGLAKLTDPSESSELDETKTVAVAESSPHTEEGTILGTAAYMSPEQAEGRKVDARSDIFSFGAVLYEMITGQRAFHGDSRMSTLAAVIRDTPKPIREIAGDVPAELEHLVNRCLRKDPQRRSRHMDELKLALEDLREDSESGRLQGPVAAADVKDAAHRMPVKRMLGTVAAVAALAIAGWYWSGHRPGGDDAPPIREIPFTADTGGEWSPSFSPDGAAIAYSAYERDVRGSAVFVKMIGAETVLNLTAGERENFVSWSPNGQWLAFTRFPAWPPPAQGSVYLIPRIGGVERKITDFHYGVLPDRFLSWLPDSESFIMGHEEKPGGQHQLSLVSIHTGERRRVTTPPAGFLGDTGPAVSPDGRTLAFTRHRSWGFSDLFLLPLSEVGLPDGEPRQLTHDVPMANSAVWTPDGEELIFCSRVFHAGTLWRVRADGSEKPSPLPFGGRGAVQPVIAPVGNRLAYNKHTWVTNLWHVRLTSDGVPVSPAEPFLQSNRLERDPQFSPDGSTIAFVSDRSGSPQVWICDADGRNLQQLSTMEANFNRFMMPKWSPDGKWVAFKADGTGNPEIYAVPVGGGRPRQLTDHPGQDSEPYWSQDGTTILFRSDRGGEGAIWKVPLTGGEVTPAKSRATGVYGPDGRLVYFARRSDSGISLWKAPSGGGQESQVSDGLARADIAVAPNGIFYIAGSPNLEIFGEPWRLVFQEFSSGAKSELATVRQGFGEGLTVSPDGLHVIYTQQDEEGDDIVLVENFR